MASDSAYPEARYGVSQTLSSTSFSISDDLGPSSTETISLSSERTSLPSSHDAEACTLSNISNCTTLSTASSSTLSANTDDSPLSTTRLLFAHIGSALALFLATTDASIVSTSLPTITRELSATRSQYTWVSIAYMLTQTAFQPLYGRLSDRIGQMTVLYCSMAIFVLGSLLCGLAKNIDWLIACRGLAGIGGGGIVSSVWVLTSQLVPEDQRAKWSQALSVTWCCSAVAGPLLGGVFSSNSSGILNWRWAFYINLPVCFVATVILYISLRNIPRVTPLCASWRAMFSRFDFIGLILFMSGTGSVIVGFSLVTEAAWNIKQTVVPIVVGVIVLVAGGVYELKTNRDPLFPSAMFTDLTVVVILLISFLHSVAFTIGTFYLVISFQVVNSMTPLQAGVSILPYSLGSSLASIPVAWFLGFWQIRHKNTKGHKFAISVGLLVASLGFGLMISLNEYSAAIARYGAPLVAGVGVGMLFHAPYQVFTRALKGTELATGTSAFFLVRFTGATIGLALAGTVFYAKASSLHILSGKSSSLDFDEIRNLEPPSARAEVVHGVLLSIQGQMVWVVCTTCLCGALLLSLLTRTMSFEEREKSSEGA